MKTKIINTAGNCFEYDSVKKALQHIRKSDRKNYKMIDKVRVYNAEILTKMSVTVTNETVTPPDSFGTAKDYFPTFEIDQAARTVTITTFETHGWQRLAKVATDELETSLSATGDSLFVRGSTAITNFKRWKYSGAQAFCFALFVGDSGLIYIHRAPASKGWMECAPEDIRKRLRRLGIGTDKEVIQQGDFLLKPANKNACAENQFKHETMGAGHHRFETPVLYAFDGTNRQFKITEPTRIVHTATDGMQHPTVLVPPGIWVVGTTASQLYHSNAAD